MTEIPVTVEAVPRDDGLPGAVLRIHGFREIADLEIEDGVGLELSDQLARLCERRVPSRRSPT